MKSLKHWKATMTPILWQGGERAPSRNNSLLCRRISSWPEEPLTGTDNLERVGVEEFKESRYHGHKGEGKDMSQLCSRGSRTGSQTTEAEYIMLMEPQERMYGLRL